MASDSDEESSFHSADEGDSDTERNEDDRKRPIHKPKVAEPKPMAALLTTDESPIGPQKLTEESPQIQLETEIAEAESPGDENDGWDDWEADGDAIKFDGSEVAKSTAPSYTTTTETPKPTTIAAPQQTIIETPQPTITESPQPTVTESPQPTITETTQPTVSQPQSLKLTSAVPTSEANLHNVLDKLNVNADKHGSSFWTGWNSILSVASELGNTVGEGFSSVLETVETTLGAPTPEELAKLSLEEKLELKRKVDDVKEPWPKEDKDDCDSAEEFASDGVDEISSGYQSDTSGSVPSKYFAADSGVFGISQLTTTLNEKGMKLVTGSIDALELLGKKTFNVLTERHSDTGRRRLIFNKEKSTLSQALRELKDKTEPVGSTQSSSSHETNQASFPAYFEKHNGFANLEALEILANNCKEQLNIQLKLSDDPTLEQKLKTLEAQLDTSNDVKSQFGSDFEDFLDDCEFNIGSHCHSAKLKEVDQKFVKWLNDCSADLHATDLSVSKCSDFYINFLAEFTAVAIEMFRKYSQLVTADKPQSDLPLSDLVKLRNCIRDRISSSANSTSQLLNSIASAKGSKTDKEDPVSRYITDVFLEADNCATSIDEAFKLISPVLQLSLVRSWRS